MNHRQRYAMWQQHLDDCRSIAIGLMESPFGFEAIQGMYYNELFQWLYGEMVAGRTPTGVPSKLLEEWRKQGATFVEAKRQRLG